MSFFWKNRLGEKPSDLLKHYYAETMREPLFLEALHQWDKAQVVVLGEGDIAPPQAVASLVKAVAEMEKEGVVEARTALWNVIHGGEEYMRKFCEEEQSGWLHLGRSSPSLRVTASRIAFRNLLLQIMSSALDLRAKMIDVAEQHVETLMPGYSYIQHIEPATFGFYLMSFVEPLERDFQRLTSSYRNANVSSVGTGAAYGIEFPLDLERFDALLGFDAAPWNARDSIRNYDYMLETYMALALMHSTLGRVAMDFLIWHSSEFDFIELPGRLSITSSISPQMRIPYVLEFIHGTSGLMTGRLMEALAITKTASDQLEMATMLPAEFWKCADESRRAMDALDGCARRHEGQQGAHGAVRERSLVAGEHGGRLSREGARDVVPHRTPDPRDDDAHGGRPQHPAVAGDAGHTGERDQGIHGQGHQDCEGCARPAVRCDGVRQRTQVSRRRGAGARAGAYRCGAEERRRGSQARHRVVRAYRSRAASAR